MRLFQNSGLSGGYRNHFGEIAAGCTTFAARRTTFLADRYGASHFLAPVLMGDEDAFFTNGDDEVLQRLWAAEQGMPASSALESILLAQIEAHRAEVFYNLDPMRWGSAFVRRLPGSVRRSICWRAAPSPSADFSAYHAVVCNFPSIIAHWQARGWRARLFYPSHDPTMDDFARSEHRPIDVLFVGTYSRHHRSRAQVLEAVAQLGGECRIQFHLDRSRVTRWAESPLGWIGPLRVHRRPSEIRRISFTPAFGLDLYRLLGQSRIVLNGAIDMAGSDRGNMRCFEAMGCGALLVSDTGNYPDGMSTSETMLTYRDAQDAAKVIRDALQRWETCSSIARAGYELVRNRYGKAAQWRAFQALVESV